MKEGDGVLARRSSCLASRFCEEAVWSPPHAGNDKQRTQNTGSARKSQPHIVLSNGIGCRVLFSKYRSWSRSKPLERCPSGLCLQLERSHGFRSGREAGRRVFRG